MEMKIFFITAEAKETVLYFLEETVQVFSFFCFTIK